MGWFRRLRATLAGSTAEENFRDEARFHLEERTDEYIRRGMSSQEARHEAQRRFGNMARVQEHTRDADTVRWLTDFGNDVRYGFRTLRKNLGFSAVAVLTLALGVGTNTAIFSAAYGMLLRPLPYQDSARLVRLSEYHLDATPPLTEAVISNLTFDAWRSTTRTLEGLAAYSERAYTATGDGEAERLRATAASPELFTVLGVSPAAGRFFESTETIDGADGVVVLSHGYWQRRFGGRPDVVGHTMTLDGRPRVIIGVAPPGFSFPDEDRQLFTPFVLPRVAGAGADQQVRVFLAIGRLAPFATTAQAEAEGTGIARGLGPRPVAADLLFGKGGPVAIRVRTIVDQATISVRPILILLTVGASLVLLLGCANVANLLLARGISREREFAVRAAIGAGRSRLLRQLFAEGVALATASAVLGVVIAWSLIQAWPSLVPRSFPRVGDVQLDTGGLLFALTLSVMVGLLVGVAPALQGANVTPVSGFREGRAGSTGSRSLRTRRGLVVLQGAFAVVLLIGAALLVRSFVRVVGRDAGYDATNVLTARISLQGVQSPATRWQQTAGAVLERLGPLPGVIATGAANMAPLGDSTHVIGFRLVRGEPDAPVARALGYVITPGYAEALQLRLHQGRLFTASDASSPTQPMLVNEEFVKSYLNDGQPVLGRRYAGLLKRDADTEIVGVIGNVLKNGFTDSPRAEVYVPLGSHGLVTTGGQINLVIRTSGDAAALAESLRTIMRDIDPDAPVHTIRVLSSDLSATAGQSRFATTVLVTFAALAVGLAALGLYGGLMYAVSRRTREFGIRASLGASRSQLVTLVVQEGLAATIAGIVLGLAIAALVTRVMQGLLFEIHPLDTVSFVAAPAILMLVALTACAIPAWRVTSIVPTEALRHE